MLFRSTASPALPLSLTLLLAEQAGSHGRPQETGLTTEEQGLSHTGQSEVQTGGAEGKEHTCLLCSGVKHGSSFEGLGFGARVFYSPAVDRRFA